MACLWYLPPKAAVCIYGLTFVLCCIVLVLLGDAVGNAVLANVLLRSMVIVGIATWCKRRSIKRQQEPQHDNDIGAHYEQVLPSEERATAEEETANSVERTTASTEPEIKLATMDSNNPDETELSAKVPTTVTASSQDHAQYPRHRLYYMDNLKSILTALVVVHHVTCACGTVSESSWFYIFGRYPNTFQKFGTALLLLNQCYFMVLFFFVSGYFSAFSLNKKKRQHKRILFLTDRYKRLFVPLVVFFVALNPLLVWLISSQLIDGSSKYKYVPFPGHLWFVFWLLLFSIAYASMMPPTNETTSQSHDTNNTLQQGSIRKEPPSPCQALCGGFAIGILQGILVVGLRVSSFVFMPLTVGSLPFDVVAFILGVKAKNHQWLERDFVQYFFGTPSLQPDDDVDEVMLESQQQRQDSTLSIEETNATDSHSCQKRRIALWLLAGLWTFLIFINEIFLKDSKNSNHKDKSSSSFSLGNMLIVSCFFGATGIICVTMCAWWVLVAMSKLNVTTPLLKRISGAAYGVYLIHPWVVVLLTALYIKILNAIHAVPNGGEVEFPNTNVSSTKLRSEVYLWVGWILLSVSSLMCSWILASCLKRLPCLNKIL